MKTIFRAAPWAAVLLFAGCNLPQPQPDTVRNFTLDGPPAGPAVTDAVRVRTVEVAGYLRRRSLAVRVAPHEVAYIEDFRWADSLETAFTRLLQDRLATVGGGATVVVTVDRCEPDRSDGNRLHFAASYVILPAGPAGGAPRRGVFQPDPQAWDGRDFNALVGLVESDVGALGDALAAAVAPGK